MKSRSIVIAATAAAVLGTSAPAFAQYAHPRGRVEERALVYPNGTLLGAGIFVFGAAYIPSVVVAATSDRIRDRALVAPIVGPWIAVTNRGSCGELGSHECDVEMGNRGLLVADGIVQAIGGITILSAFFTPARRATVVMAEPKPTVRVTPLVGSVTGVGASGQF